ncbi:LysR family transcriptional regulator [Parasalinivibrio latis]|uniref:LysR family transcriptional regulator n=1 Tax=Parasalinivibrio latis TaxID=2952610 RepID=UPI0030E13391
MKLDDLNLFRVVVEQGSYTAASRHTQVPVATITRRIQALEDSIDIRLLNRHARKLSLTEAGKKFYDECGPLLQELVNASEHVTEECKGAAGKLKISAPANLSNRLIQPLLNAFMIRYPAINIELLLSNQTDQLDPTEWDAIFHVGKLRDSSLIARKVYSLKDILVASPTYLTARPRPKHASELNDHALLKGAPLMRWRLTSDNGEAVTISERGKFEASDLNVVRSAACAGLGIALVPDLIVDHYLDDGRLTQVLPDWHSNPRDIYLVYNHREHQPEKLKLFIDFASHYFD